MKKKRNLIPMKPDNAMHIEPMLSLDISFVSNKKGNRFLIGMNKFSQKTWMDGSLDLSDSYEPHVMSKKVKFISRVRERHKKKEMIKFPLNEFFLSSIKCGSFSYVFHNCVISFFTELSCFHFIFICLKYIIKNFPLQGKKACDKAL